MQKNLLCGLVLVGLINLIGCASTSFDETQPCAKNFEVIGAGLEAREYQTRQVNEGVSLEESFRKVAQAIARANYQQIDIQLELGLITAAYIDPSGTIHPLSVVIEETADGQVSVEASFQMASIKLMNTKGLRVVMCNIVSAPSS